jgi:6-phosphofructokinase 2
MAAAPILTVTLNPALDVTTSTNKLFPQQKLRCDPPVYDAGGGGVNVSRAIRELRGDSVAFIALAGATGEHYRRLVAESGIVNEVWSGQGETRSSMTVMEKDTGLHYRFVLPGPPQPADEDARILARLDELLATGFRFVVGSGSLPPGIPADFYGRLASLARRHGSRLILDTHGDALRAAIAHRPYLIRLNHLEAQELIGGEASAAALELAVRLVAGEAAEVVIITLGGDGAIVRSKDEAFEVRPPKVAVRSAVGAGDSFVGALTFGLSRDWPLAEAARYGAAAAASAVTGEATDLCKRADVNRYFAEIGGRTELLE